MAIAGLCNFLNLYTPQSILPTRAASFHVAPARTGLTITAPLVAVALVARFVGTISDRLGRKRLIVTAMAVLTAPTLLTAGAQSLAAMLVWRFLQGLWLLTTPISTALVLRIGRRLTVGLYVTTFYIGGALGGIVPAAVWQAQGWPGVVMLMLALLGAMLVLSALFWHEGAEQRKALP